MENSIYIALSKQVTQRANMNVIANNIANMNTSGFRAQNLLFSEYLFEPKSRDIAPREAGDDVSFVYNRGQYENTTSGSFRQTGNPLDVAIEGPGFFGIQGPGDELMYSRAGQFATTPDGTLVNSAGYRVASQGGGDITIPEGSTEINIDYRGNVSNQNGQLGQIMMVEFENPQLLEARGDLLYQSPQEGNPAENSRSVQGSYEGSNVKPIVEMTNMIETLRVFQSTQNVLRTENERLRGAIQRLVGQS